MISILTATMLESHVMQTLLKVTWASNSVGFELGYKECISLFQSLPSGSDGIPDGACDTTMNVVHPFPQADG